VKGREVEAVEEMRRQRGSAGKEKTDQKSRWWGRKSSKAKKRRMRHWCGRARGVVPVGGGAWVPCDKRGVLP